MFNNERRFTFIDGLFVFVVVAIIAAITIPGIIHVNRLAGASRRGSTETFVETVHRDHQKLVQAPSHTDTLRGRFRVTGFDRSNPGVVKVFFERAPEGGEEAMPFSGITMDQTVREGDEVDVVSITYVHDLGGNKAQFYLVTKK